MTFALIWTALKGYAASTFAFLAKLSPYQLACIALSIVCAIQFVHVHGLKIGPVHIVGLETQVKDARAQIAADAAAAKKLSDEAKAVKENADKLTSGISTLIRSKNDEQNNAIAGDAGTLGVSGPGKSACRAGPPASPGGHVAPAAVPDAPGPALPPADGANVPWQWLVQRAQEHDQLLADEQAWRDWYAQILKVWPKTGAPAK